jgi:TPR repeat protein
MLARDMARGLGGPQDVEAARHHYARAVALGTAGAAEELNVFEQMLTKSTRSTKSIDIAAGGPADER